jgi:peptide/nickel transport system substrate-binding protein
MKRYLKTLMICTVTVILFFGLIVGGLCNTDNLLRMSMANVPVLDPGVGSDEAAAAIYPNLYDSLVFPTHEGLVVPSLATDWTISEDNLTWEFNLRKGVKFHNGDEVTASDVVFSMNRLLTIGQGYGYLFQGRVAKISAADTYKVQVVFDKPYGPFLSTLVRLYILNEDQVMANIKKDGPYGEFGDYGKEWLLNHDAGSGPYMLAEYAQNQYVTCDKFSEYWQDFDANNPDRFKIIGNTEAVTIRTMMLRKELEITDSFQSTETLASLDATDGIDVMSFFGGTIMYLTLNNQVAPTDDIHFRKAIAYLVDRETMVKKIFPGCAIADSPVSNALAGYKSGAFNYSYNLEKAAEELKQSKYYKDLDKYPFEVVWISQTPEREKLALSIQADAAKIGLKIKVTKVPWLSLVEMGSNAETTPTAVTVLTTPHYAEAGSPLSAQYSYVNTGSWETLDWVQNKEIDAMIKDALFTIDVDQRMEKYQEIQVKLMESCPTIPLFNVAEKHAYQSAYVSWEAADRAAKGQLVVPVMGYQYYMRNIKVYPDKK